VLAATTEKSAAPASPTPPSTSVANAPLPTEAPSPEGDRQDLTAEDPLPRLLVVAGMSLLVLSVVTLLIGLARRSRP
jgi:hypothetical protein